MLSGDSHAEHLFSLHSFSFLMDPAVCFPRHQPDPFVPIPGLLLHHAAALQKEGIKQNSVLRSRNCYC